MYAPIPFETLERVANHNSSHAAQTIGVKRKACDGDATCEHRYDLQLQALQKMKECNNQPNLERQIMCQQQAYDLQSNKESIHGGMLSSISQTNRHHTGGLRSFALQTPSADPEKNSKSKGPAWIPNSTNFVAVFTQKESYNGENGHTCMGCHCNGSRSCGEPECDLADVQAAHGFHTMTQSKNYCSSKSCVNGNQGYNCTQIAPTVIKDVGMHDKHTKMRILGFVRNNWASFQDKRQRVAIGVESDIQHASVVNALIDEEVTAYTGEDRRKMHRAIGKYCLTVRKSNDCIAGKKCPIMLQSSEGGEICRRWHTTDKNTKQVGDEAIRSHCTKNPKEFWCDCASRGNPKGRMNEIYRALTNLNGIAHNSDQCFFTPCRGTDARDGGRLVPASMMTDLDNCKIPMCSVINNIGGKGSTVHVDNWDTAITCSGPMPTPGDEPDEDDDDVVPGDEPDEDGGDVVPADTSGTGSGGAGGADIPIAPNNGPDLGPDDESIDDDSENDIPDDDDFPDDADGDDAGGSKKMSTTTKVAIGVSVTALIGGGIYYVWTKE